MKNGIIRISKIALPGAAVLGLVVILVNPGEKPFSGWLGAAFLSLLFITGILFAFEKLHSPRQVKTITIVNFLLRVIVGIALFLLLPIWGYEEEPPQAGYLYLDAYRRDGDAWQIASSDEPLFAGFQDDFYTDQYGGMLSLSASVYRLFSPDAQRPLLIMFLTAFISSLGIPFFWQALHEQFNDRIANTASWILTLYPESIILGGSQMREPLIIGLCGIILWGLVHYKQDERTSLISLFISMLVLTLVSTRYAVAILFLILLWIWANTSSTASTTKQKLRKTIPLLVVILAGLAASTNWLVNTARWDLYLMESSSGRIQFELDNIGENLRIPFLVIYGMLQPVLPAAIAYPGIAIMRIIAIFRSLGWYIAAPTLLVAPFFISKENNSQNRRLLFATIFFILFWVLLSSLRAGGDQWDNPRYRTAILPWIAFVISWVLVYFKESENPWLKRMYWITGIFCLFFIQWYLSRYYKLWARLPFTQMIVVLFITIVVMLLGFILYDHVYKASGKRN
ncbi:MAG: hypothetical protein GYA18_06545 [Chloroflexi bacterium]|nr:hypothetical protein [Chloroflexota bacterium]